MDIIEVELRGSSEIMEGETLFIEETSDPVVAGTPTFDMPFGSGEGRTVRMEDNDGGEATV